MIKPPRTSREQVLCIKQELVDCVGRFFGVSDSWEPFIDALQSPGALDAIDRRRAELSDAHKQLVVYVLLETDDGRLLSYRRGKRTSVPAMLRGAACLGFGGHVQAIDRRSTDVLADVIHAAALRELSEELAGCVPRDLRIDAVLNDDSSPEGLRHFAIVVRGTVPVAQLTQLKDFRTILKLRALTPTEAWRHYSDYEFWSQLLLSHYFRAAKQGTATDLRLSGNPRRASVMAVVGETATGKTTIVEHLRDKFGYTAVATRPCVAQLIGERDFGTRNRHRFQERAADFVHTHRGARALAHTIAREVRLAPLPVVVDGVRTLSTIHELRREFPDLRVVYVDAPRDQALRNYRLRAGREVTLAEFRSVRAHPVESEIPLIRPEADLFIYNAGTRGELLKAVTSWCTSRS